MTDVDPISTSDTPFAAYLLYHNHQFVGLVPDKNDRKSLIFTFIKQENSDLLADDYYEGNPQVNPRDYFRMTKRVHRLIGEYKDKK